jgi:hypothetical protein
MTSPPKRILLRWIAVLPAAAGALIAVRYATLAVNLWDEWGVSRVSLAPIALPLAAFFFVYAGGRVAPYWRVGIGMSLTALLFFAFAELPWLSYPWTLTHCERGWVEPFIAASGAVAAWQLFREKRDAERERKHDAELRDYREAFERAAEAAGLRKEEI